jgi:hypothetical protein
MVTNHVTANAPPLLLELTLEPTSDRLALKVLAFSIAYPTHRVRARLAAISCRNSHSVSTRVVTSGTIAKNARMPFAA